MVALVGIGLWILAGLTNASESAVVVALAWLSRVATFVFIIFYTALDSIGGFGLARAILNSQSLAAKNHWDAAQMGAVITLLNTNWTDSWVGGVGSKVSLTGSWAVFFAALFLAFALVLDKKASWIAALILVGFGWELQVSHTMPNGPIAFALLIVAAIWIRRTNRDAATA